MTPDKTDADQIAAVRQEHVDAVNTTDVELLLKGFADDVVYIAPQAPPILGKSAMREFITPIYATASIHIGMKCGALEVSGDRATEWGTCHGELSLNEGGTNPVNLQYVLVYRREHSGEWRVSHNISTPGPS